MSIVRLRRLHADFQNVSDYVRRHPRLTLVKTQGDPPDRYEIEYRIKSLRQRDGELVPVETHRVEVFLPLDYPKLPPQCRMLTPVFHPNIAPHAICIGDHWAAGESLASLVARIGEILAYQSYNTKSPLNGEAARWTDQNIDQLPLDRVNMNIDAAATPAAPGSAPPAPAVRLAPTPPPAPRPATTPPPPPPGPAAEPAARVIHCDQCRAPLRIKAAMAGQKMRCPKCKQIFVAPRT